MIDLNTYIEESIFDEKDMMDGIDKVVDISVLKRGLTNVNDFVECMEKFMENVKKYNKVPVKKITSKNNYIFFTYIKGKYYNEYNITLYEGVRPRIFPSYVITGRYPTERGPEIGLKNDEIEFRKAAGILVKDMCNDWGKEWSYFGKLPKEYNWMFDWIIEESAKRR